MKIAFGTDGWRARADDGGDFNESNVELVIQALAGYWRTQGLQGTAAIIGYDRRRDSQKMAGVVAEVLLGNGFDVLVSSQFCPTPTVSWMVKNRGAIGGVVVTASHNPWQWNGIKFKESYGGSASPEYTKGVEAMLEANTGRTVKRGLLAKAATFDPHEAYGRHLTTLIDVDRIRKSGIAVLYDPMYGAGTGFIKRLFPHQVTEIHDGADDRFGGTNPQPISPHFIQPIFPS